MHPALELKDVSSGYNGKLVLHDITFRAEDSAIYVVLGPNGAGKTTLFRTISGNTCTSIGRSDLRWREHRSLQGNEEKDQLSLALQCPPRGDDCAGRPKVLRKH